MLEVTLTTETKLEVRGYRCDRPLGIITVFISLVNWPYFCTAVCRTSSSTEIALEVGACMRVPLGNAGRKCVKGPLAN